MVAPAAVTWKAVRTSDSSITLTVGGSYFGLALASLGIVLLLLSIASHPPSGITRAVFLSRNPLPAIVRVQLRRRGMPRLNRHLQN